MRGKLKVLLMSLITAFSLGSVAVATLAWFVAERALPNIDINGTSKGAYFEYGDGSIDNPFGIKTPRQLYNLAWLQYYGMFNRDTNSDGVIDQQYHFELAGDIDMTGWELPPIGTKDNPFLGEFNGNSHTISNLTVSNKSEFNRKPAAIPYNVQPEIVGFFGVIGGGAQTIPYSYTPGINEVYDFTLNNVTVESKTTNTLIGIAAGYVNGGMTDVKVGKAKLDTNGNSKLQGFDNLSKHGLVGYTVNESTNGSYSQTVSQWYDSSNPSQGGDESPDLGGATSTADMYSRLKSIMPLADTHYGRKQTVTQTGPDTFIDLQTINIPNSNKLHDYENNNGYVGSFCFADADANSQQDIIGLSGTRIVKKEVKDMTNSVSMVFFNSTYASGNKYLEPRHNTTQNVFSNVYGGSFTDNPSVSQGWYFTNTNFTISDGATLGGLYSIDDLGDGNGPQKLYLNLQSISSKIWARQTAFALNASVPSSEEYVWKIKKASDTQTSINGVNYTRYNISAKIGGKEYYLAHSGALSNTSGASNQCYAVRLIDYANYYTVNSDLTDSNETYFPLITEDNSNAAKNSNTGYVVSSGDFDGNSDLLDSGTITVGRYEKSGNFDYSATTAKNTIYTIYGGTDTDGTLAQNVSAYSEFEDKYSSFNPTSTCSTYFYGLKFKESLISASNTVTIPKGKLNYETFNTGREFLKNSINFSLGRKGNTSFFAGTFREGATNAFFSLHKVNRSGTSITSVEEILQIYGHKTDSTKDYIYKTSLSSPTIDSTNYELLFDTSWITNPDDITEHKIYFFQIPLNQGEYALGSIPHKAGAFLLYFDIGADELANQDVVTGYYVKTMFVGNPFPLGVDFDCGGSNDGGDTLGVTIENGQSGTVTFVVGTNSVDLAITYSTLTYSYKASGITATVSQGNSPNAPPSTDGFGSISYHFITTINNTSHHAVITHKLDATGAETSEPAVYELDGSASTFSAINSTAGVTESNINALKIRPKAVVLTRTQGTAIFEVTPAYNVSDRTNITLTFDTTGFKVKATEIPSGITVKIGDTTLANNGEYTI